MTTPIWHFLVLIFLAAYTPFTIRAVYKKYKSKKSYKKTGLSMIFLSLFSLLFIIIMFFIFQDMDKRQRKLFSSDIFLTISLSFIYSFYMMVGGLYLLRSKIQSDSN